MPDNRDQGMNWIRLSTRMAIYARDRFDCVYCRLVFPLDPHGYGLTLDHVHGSSNDPSNLVTCCNECNASKKNTPLGLWSSSRTAKDRVRRALARPIDRVLGRCLAAERKAGRTQIKGQYVL